MKMIKENALYRYSEGRGHCKHGIVYTMKDKKGQMWAVDTYWDSRFSKGLNQDKTYYAVSDIADDMEFIMMIDDAREVNQNEFYLYTNDYKDGLHIPVGGWHERYLVNKNANKNKHTVIDYIKYKIGQSENDVKRLNKDIVELNKWLDTIENDPKVANLYTDDKYVWDVETAIERAASK